MFKNERKYFLEFNLYLNLNFLVKNFLIFLINFFFFFFINKLETKK